MINCSANALKVARTHTCSVPIFAECVLQDLMFTAVDITHKHTLTLPLDSVHVESWNIRFPVFVQSLYSQLQLCSSSVSTQQHCIRAISAAALQEYAGKLCQWISGCQEIIPPAVKTAIWIAGSIGATVNPKGILMRFYWPGVFCALCVICPEFRFVINAQLLFLRIFLLLRDPRWPCFGASRGWALWRRKSRRKREESIDIGINLWKWRKRWQGHNAKQTLERKMRAYLHGFLLVFWGINSSCVYAWIDLISQPWTYLILASNQLYQERGPWFWLRAAGAVPCEMWSCMWGVTAQLLECPACEATQTEANCNLLSLAVTLCTAIPSNRQISALREATISTIHCWRELFKRNTQRDWVKTPDIFHLGCFRYNLSVSYCVLLTTKKWIKGELQWFFLITISCMSSAGLKGAFESFTKYLLTSSGVILGCAWKLHLKQKLCFARVWSLKDLGNYHTGRL